MFRFVELLAKLDGTSVAAITTPEVLPGKEADEDVETRLASAKSGKFYLDSTAEST